METIVLVAPTVEPITLDEAKTQLRIELGFTLDDDYIDGLISTSRDRCESYCNQYFTTQDISILYDGSIPAIIKMPYPNLTVTSLTYTDSDNVEQTVDSGDYIVSSKYRTITITSTFSAINYQVQATTAPPVQIVGVQHAIKLILDNLYGLRSEIVVGATIANNPTLKALLYPYRESLGI